MAERKPALGRGLGSLIAGGSSATHKKPRDKKPGKPKAARKKGQTGKPAPVSTAPEPSSAPGPATPAALPPVDGLAELPIQQIEPNPHQPRRTFDATALNELAESIRAEGLLQPIVVRRVGEHYELIAGERRWRACQQLGLPKIPARIIAATEASSAVLSLVENLQRADLNPLEEALGYASLMRDFDLTQEAVAQRVGKGRATIANSLRLLQLDPETQSLVRQSLLSVGHAKVLLGIEDTQQRQMLARLAVERSLSVREMEKALQQQRQSVTAASKASRRAGRQNLALERCERRLGHFLGTPVSLKAGARKGQMVIEFFGDEDLQRILERIGLPSE